MDSLCSIDDERITLFGHFIESHARLTSILDAELREAVDLPLLWFGVLLHLGRSPGGERPMGELVEATAFTSGGVTRLVDRMEQAGLVRRRPCTEDRRVQYVGLTDTGRDRLCRAVPVHVDGIQRHLMEPLGAEGAIALDAAVRVLSGPHQGFVAKKRVSTSE